MRIHVQFPGFNTSSSLDHKNLFLYTPGKHFLCQKPQFLAGLPRAPRNMVNFFSFCCHVINRAYVPTRLQIVRVSQGRLSKGREGRLRRVLASPRLLYRTFTIWSINSCQNSIATDQYPMTISRAHVSTHRSDVICLETVR